MGGGVSTAGIGRATGLSADKMGMRNNMFGVGITNEDWIRGTVLGLPNRQTHQALGNLMKFGNASAPQGGLTGPSPLDYAPPAFQSALGPGGGLLPQYQMNFQTLDPTTFAPNTQGLEKMRELGTGSGLTESGKLAQKRLGLLTQQQIQGAQQQGLAGVSSGMAQLGAYGVGGGARERMMNQANRQAMNAAQQIRGQSALSDLDIQRASAEQRMAALQGLPQAELSYAGFGRDTALQNANIINAQRQANIQNALSGLSAQNLYNQNLYGIQMGARGAEQTAQAMAQPQKQGLFGGLFGGK